MPENTFSSSQEVFPAYQPWAQRNGFSHGALALVWMITAFILFQVVAGIVGVVLVLLRVSDSGGPIDPGNIMAVLQQNLDLVFFANTTGQIIFLGLATWFFCRLQVTKARRPAFLRVKYHANTTALIGIVIATIIAAQPVIWFLGWINSFVPVPEGVQQMQLEQLNMIEAYLTSDGSVWLALFHIGVVPSVCEEVLFRGYLLRSFEKSWGIKVAIVLSGILFGLYHLQLSNFLPLAAIGILLAVITWATESIIPAMVAHLVNNGGSVLLGKFYPDTAFSEVSPQTMPPIWLVVVGGAISGYLIYVLLNNQTKQQVNTQGGAYD